MDKLESLLSKYEEPVDEVAQKDKPTILVIDDDELLCSIFKETLTEEGHVVVPTVSCALGIDCVENGDFDMVFLDLKMPDMDGAEAFRQIREIAPKLPVTIITGYPDSDMMARALKYGPFRVMAKPFDAEAIIEAVHCLLPMIPTGV